ncbi:MAG: hypothetical protein H8E26_14200 [FCB group bacterium]|nr:hypothetical protein [FCB group bacterium]MBL7027436.1 hypothetical protein [Candidatus Neomarinimicrobiota bacterium]
MKFKVGDEVYEAVPGPIMKITEIQENNRVKCSWFDKHDVRHIDIFEVGALKIFDPGEFGESEEQHDVWDI